jgi:hypothetical protein
MALPALIAVFSLTARINKMSAHFAYGTIWELGHRFKQAAHRVIIEISDFNPETIEEQIVIGEKS